MIEVNPLKLPVRTESGQHLGIVVGVTIDPATQGVLSYHVKPSRLIPDLVRSPLIIGRQQVISIDAEKMVVADSVVRQPATAPEPTVS